ncbi:hypothetical protein B0H10DRAFT_1944633 [Mycena sp. CBHHK59/15]|nr:hypothetical protein B0H10DRAFT_1944633 [Mycena sp. CBHHK59/15]
MYPLTASSGENPLGSAPTRSGARDLEKGSGGCMGVLRAVKFRSAAPRGQNSLSRTSAREIKAKEEAVKLAEAATKKAEEKAAAAKAKAAAKEAVALEKAKAEYEKEVAALTKLAAQKRDDAIKHAGEELKKAVTTASIIRCKEEAGAQSARAKADEKAAKKRLEAEKAAWKGRQAAEKEAHGAFAKAEKLAGAEREKAEKTAEAARKEQIKQIMAVRERAFKEAEAEKKKTEEEEEERAESVDNNVQVVDDPNLVLPQTTLEWIASFIWGSKPAAAATPANTFLPDPDEQYSSSQTSSGPHDDSQQFFILHDDTSATLFYFTTLRPHIPMNHDDDHFTMFLPLLNVARDVHRFELRIGLRKTFTLRANIPQDVRVFRVWVEDPE